MHHGLKKRYEFKNGQATRHPTTLLIIKTVYLVMSHSTNVYGLRFFFLLIHMTKVPVHQSTSKTIRD